MGLPTGYDILGYGRMVTSEPRMSAYAQALREAITPGCTVFDIGAGPGVFSILACQFGAGSVVAIETGDIIQLGRQFAAANNCADRITFVQGLSTDYQPASQADVIISDIRGGLPLFEGHIPAIVDARQRLLRPGGSLIPMRDTIRIALAENAAAYLLHERPWLDNRFGLDLSAGASFATSIRTKAAMSPADLLSAAEELLVLDYREMTQSDADCSVRLAATRAGTAHGLQLWFDAELADGIGFSTAPGEPEQIYGQNFFPLARPVQLAPGDCVDVQITARLVDGTYVWGWNSSIRRAGASQPEESFRQSSFGAKIMSPDSLRTRAADFRPPAQETHEVDRLCLSLVDGKRTLAEIASRIQSRFPERFANASKALNHVVELTNRYRQQT
jgi:type I protein arginine methyltransferase